MDEYGAFRRTEQDVATIRPRGRRFFASEHTAENRQARLAGDAVADMLREGWRVIAICENGYGGIRITAEKAEERRKRVVDFTIAAD